MITLTIGEETMFANRRQGLEETLRSSSGDSPAGNCYGFLMKAENNLFFYTFGKMKIDYFTFLITKRSLICLLFLLTWKILMFQIG